MTRILTLNIECTFPPEAVALLPTYCSQIKSLKLSEVMSQADDCAHVIPVLARKLTRLHPQTPCRSPR